MASEAKKVLPSVRASLRTLPDHPATRGVRATCEALAEVIDKCEMEPMERLAALRSLQASLSQLFLTPDGRPEQEKPRALTELRDAARRAG